MFKSFSSFSHLRTLTLLLLLLSADVHSNPGPIIKTFNRENTMPTDLNFSITGPSPSKLYDTTFTIFYSGGISGLLTTPWGDIPIKSSSTGVFSMSFREVSQSVYNFSISDVSGSRFGCILVYNDPISSNVPVPLDVKVINSSIEPVPTLPIISNPVPVSLVNPSVIPVQIENVDPIEVEFAIGEPLPVSVINPTVFPVQIDNIDPIEVTIPTTAPIPITGQVSIANPIPSVASTILNAFKK